MVVEVKLKNQNIRRLDIDDNTIGILEKENINDLGSLCKKTKTELRKMDISQNVVKQIETQLQLMGLNLKNNLW